VGSGSLVRSRSRAGLGTRYRAPTGPQFSWRGGAADDGVTGPGVAGRWLHGLLLQPGDRRGGCLRGAARPRACACGAAALLLDAGGVSGAPLLIAIMLSATSLGVVIPVLKDSGEASTQFGQIVIAAASIADLATIVLLSLFFSEKSSGVGAKLVLLGGFGVLIAAVAFAVARAGHSMRISAALVRLQDTTAQIRVRGAFVLLAAFVVLAEKFGLEAILGAFMAGAVLKLVDTDGAMTHPQF
jgi:Sodium/hydrogen exchanger family